jgi:hypothetical protein
MGRNVLGFLSYEKNAKNAKLIYQLVTEGKRKEKIKKSGKRKGILDPRDVFLFPLDSLMPIKSPFHSSKL